MEKIEYLKNFNSLIKAICLLPKQSLSLQLFFLKGNSLSMDSATIEDNKKFKSDINNDFNYFCFFGNIENILKEKVKASLFIHGEKDVFCLTLENGEWTNNKMNIENLKILKKSNFRLVG